MIGVESDEMKKFLDSRIHIDLSGQVMDLEWLHQDLANRPSRVEAGRRVLKDDLCFLSHLL